VDVHITIDGSQTLEDAHAMTETVEQAIRDILPESDVTIHPEPATPPEPIEIP
jgi:divalent metal cation (Fe/Co/Zn/Cd) transporter